MNDKRDATLGLAETLAALRAELKRSQTLANDSNIKFEIQNIDLELKVHVEDKTKESGKLDVKFWVVQTGVSGEGVNTNSRTQTIKLSMKAKDLESMDDNGKVRDANVRG